MFASGKKKKWRGKPKSEEGRGKERERKQSIRGKDRKKKREGKLNIWGNDWEKKGEGKMLWVAGEFEPLLSSICRFLKMLNLEVATRPILIN